MTTCDMSLQNQFKSKIHFVNNHIIIHNAALLVDISIYILCNTHRRIILPKLKVTKTLVNASE